MTELVQPSAIIRVCEANKANHISKRDTPLILRHPIPGGFCKLFPSDEKDGDGLRKNH